MNLLEAWNRMTSQFCMSFEIYSRQSDVSLIKVLYGFSPKMFDSLDMGTTWEGYKDIKRFERE